MKLTLRERLKLPEGCSVRFTDRVERFMCPLCTMIVLHRQVHLHEPGKDCQEFMIAKEHTARCGLPCAASGCTVDQLKSGAVHALGVCVRCQN